MGIDAVIDMLMSHRSSGATDVEFIVNGKRNLTSDKHLLQCETYRFSGFSHKIDRNLMKTLVLNLY